MHGVSRELKLDKIMLFLTEKVSLSLLHRVWHKAVSAESWTKAMQNNVIYFYFYFFPI